MTKDQMREIARKHCHLGWTERDVIAAIEEAVSLERDKEIAALRQQLEVAQKDAARYRWFRNHARCTYDEVLTTWYFLSISKGGVQDAIDAAMKKGND